MRILKFQVLGIDVNYFLFFLKEERGDAEHATILTSVKMLFEQLFFVLLAWRDKASTHSDLHWLYYFLSLNSICVVMSNSFAM